MKDRYKIDESRRVYVYKNLHKNCYSVRQDGLVKMHTDGICLYDAQFRVGKKGRERVLEEGRTVYGINTGFGLLANTKIAQDELELLQRSIVLSHAAGIGEFMSPQVVRLLMLLKINSLSRGFSGIRLSVIEALITLVNAQVLPAIPEKGSVGASGDLAPLAHMSAVLLGEGQVLYQGNVIDAKLE